MPVVVDEPRVSNRPRLVFPGVVHQQDVPEALLRRESPFPDATCRRAGSADAPEPNVAEEVTAASDAPMINRTGEHYIELNAWTQRANTNN